MFKICPFFGMAILLTGCASVYLDTNDQMKWPDLKGTVAGAPDDAKSIANKAAAEAERFAEIANELKKHDVGFDGGLIAVAMGAAATLLYVAAPAQADVAGGIALGAGGITAVRGRLDFKSAAKAYNTAALHLICVTNKTTPMVAADTLEASALQKLRGQLAADSTLLSINVGELKDPEKAEASAAITAANAAIQLVAQVNLALTIGPTTAAVTIKNIEIDLSNALDGQSIDFSTLRDSLVSGAKSKAANDVAAEKLSSSTGNTPPTGNGASNKNLMMESANALKPQDLLQRVQIEIGLAQQMLSDLPYQNVISDVEACRAS
jgi:hypothetical protein